eukprot:6178161-Pleurochrysis_carterae.AAC.1
MQYIAASSFQVPSRYCSSVGALGCADGPTRRVAASRANLSLRATPAPDSAGGARLQLST